MDVGFEFPQHHVRYSRGTQWNLGFRDSDPGSYFQSYVQQHRHFSVLLHPTRWMLRHGGLGHRGQSFADADTYTASKFDTDADTQTHAHTNTNTDTGVLRQFHDSRRMQCTQFSHHRRWKYSAWLAVALFGYHRQFQYRCWRWSADPKQRRFQYGSGRCSVVAQHQRHTKHRRWN